MSSPLVFDSVKKNRYNFPQLNHSNSFGTVDYDAPFYTKIDFSINHIFKYMTVQKLSALHHTCEFERTKC